MPTSYAIAGTCLSTAAGPVQLRQLLRDPAPLVAIAQLNPMAAAALSEAWESSHGVKPISLDRLRVAFDAQYSARQVREGLAGVPVTGTPLAPEDWITAESSLVSAVGDATLVYRIDTFRQRGDGSRLAVGPALNITVTWSSFAWVLDTPAQLNFEVLRYQLAAWGTVEASFR